MVKYQAQITFIGPMVSEFMDHNIVVLFGSSAPDELQEFAILHNGTELYAPLKAGDTVILSGTSFAILAVGDVSNDNLANLGHLVLKFNGETVPEMPGDVCLEKKSLPSVKVGSMLLIEGKE
jgi:glucitol/sorbitol PTS system EIIA component